MPGVLVFRFRKLFQVPPRCDSAGRTLRPTVGFRTQWWGSCKHPPHSRIVGPIRLLPASASVANPGELVIQ